MLLNHALESWLTCHCKSNAFKSVSHIDFIYKQTEKNQENKKHMALILIQTFNHLVTCGLNRSVSTIAFSFSFFWLVTDVVL